MRLGDAPARYAALRWVVILGVALFLACHPQPPADQTVPPAVVPDAAFNRLFAARGNGWTGADGTLSIRIPDGRTLWLFGDTFLGRINPDGTRPEDSPFIRNSALVQTDGLLTPLYGQRHGEPVALFRPAARGEWYWPGDGTLEDRRLLIFLHRFRQDRPGLWGWQWTGTEIAIVGLPDLDLAGIRPLPVANGVRYGAALLEHRGQVFIFGVTAGSGPKGLHVARGRQGSLLSTAWAFYDGRQWSPEPDRSASILTGVGSQFSMVPFRQGFALITMDGRTPFSGRLVAYTAPRPEGPFQGPVLIYEAPEASDAVTAYNPFVHPQFSHRGRILISYNVNHLHDPDMLYRDAGIYRPRFIRVNLERLLPPIPGVKHEFGGSWG